MSKAISVTTPSIPSVPKPWIRSAPIEGVERLENAQEYLLREVLGLVVPAHELVRDIENLAPVLPDDELPRRLITTEAPADEGLRDAISALPG